MTTDGEVEEIEVIFDRRTDQKIVWLTKRSRSTGRINVANVLPNQSQKTQGFRVADFAALSDERRSSSRFQFFQPLYRNFLCAKFKQNPTRIRTGNKDSPKSPFAERQISKIPCRHFMWLHFK